MWYWCQFKELMLGSRRGRVTVYNLDQWHRLVFSVWKIWDQIAEFTRCSWTHRLFSHNAISWVQNKLFQSWRGALNAPPLLPVCVFNSYSRTHTMPLHVSWNEPFTWRLFWCHCSSLLNWPGTEHGLSRGHLWRRCRFISCVWHHLCWVEVSESESYLC